MIQRTYHELYRSHLPLLFSRIFREFPTEMSPERAAEIFLRLLEEGGAPEKGAEKVLSVLSEATGGKYRICVATNGLHAIQTGRLKGMEKYFYRVYISEDIGVIKPLSAFFARILSDLHTTKDKCLMIGDSLESDIAGAKGAGIDSCWGEPVGQDAGGDFARLYRAGAGGIVIASRVSRFVLQKRNAYLLRNTLSGLCFCHPTHPRLC